MPQELLADITGLTTEDFEIVDAGERDIDASLDLVAIAVIP